MALVPQVVDAVNIPVIAAGGIADGRQIAAAFMLGAQGVQVGTRFLVAKECTISQEYKNKILKARDIDTVVTGKDSVILFVQSVTRLPVNIQRLSTIRLMFPMRSLKIWDSADSEEL